MKTFVGRAGRMYRFCLGVDAPPQPRFFVAESPVFERGDDLPLGSDDTHFSFGSLLAGRLGTTPLSLEVTAKAGTRVHGFGAATGAASRNDAHFRVMTLDTAFYGIEGSSYTAFPFFMLRTPGERQLTAVMLVTSFPLEVEIRDARDVVTIRMRAAVDSEGDPLDVIVFRGTPAEVLWDLTSLVGRAHVPPMWALGFHQSRWSYKTQVDALAVAQRFRREDLPADAIHLDIHHMDRYRVLTWDPDRFPAPRLLHDELTALGFHSCAIVDPGVSVADDWATYRGLLEGGFTCKTAHGHSYRGKVWPGATVFPDFFQDGARKFWGSLLKVHTDAGVSGFWNDMNDPTLIVGKTYDPLREDIRHAAGSHARLRNLYANEMAHATHDGVLALRPGRRPFLLTRSGFLGIQRHAAVWTGDNHSTWKHLKENVHMAVNLGLSGVPIVGADVGGFAGRARPMGALKWRPPRELFARWMELGALMPFFRVHTSLFSPRQEPWSFGKAILGLARRQLRRRYRLLLHFYALAFDAAVDGAPIIRPMWWRDDVREHVISGVGAEQFFIGDSLLAAPVVDKGASKRTVCLPRGHWIDFDNGDELIGPAQIVRDAPLGISPLFARGGSVIFTGAVGRNSHDTRQGPIAMEVNAFGDEGGEGQLVLDDGSASDAVIGQRFELRVHLRHVDDRALLTLVTEHAGFAPLQRTLELRAPARYVRAIVDGRVVALTQRAGDAERPRRFAIATIPIDAKNIVLET
jgi:alpha-glucosidase